MIMINIEKEGDGDMKIKVEKIIEKSDYITVGNLDIGKITEISIENAMHLPGRCVNKDDLHLEECELSLSRICQME